MQESNWKEMLLWLTRRRRRCRVTGTSMLPLLSAEDEVLVDLQAYRRQPPLIGDIVIARHPTQTGQQIIKRIKGMDEDGRYQLRGDNPDPTRNSSVLVHCSLILGRVTSRFAAVK
ncbi:MAG: S26 family signal peptidase [Desulfuromonadales bacterium]